MSVKDRLGNELKVGDFVSVTVGSLRDPSVLAEMVGDVIAIELGGIVVPGGQRGRPDQQKENITASRVVLQLTVQVLADPRQPECSNILKITDPAREKLKAEIAARAASAGDKPN